MINLFPEVKGVYEVGKSRSMSMTTSLLSHAFRFFTEALANTFIMNNQVNALAIILVFVCFFVGGLREWVWVGVGGEEMPFGNNKF